MRACLLICLIMSSCLLYAQEENSFLVTGEFASFSVDNLGYIYAVTGKGQQLKKYKPDGDSMTVFNDVRRFGKLTSVNTQNALRTLLFYKDFRTILVLDRFLHSVNVIDLRKLNLFQVRQIAPSYDNHIWVYDEQESKLKKISESGKILLETADLRIVSADNPMPEKMIDQNGYVYLYDPIKGMFIFDYYGALKGKIAIFGWKNVQVTGQTILGMKDGKSMQYTTGSLQLKESDLPKFSYAVKDLQFTSSGIFILDERGIRRLKF